MIHSITANQPSFRPVELTPGLNVILADRADGSSDKDTRNGLGKSTLIEIIHFCLGARVHSGQGLAIPALQEWAFTMEMSLGGDRIAVTRTLASRNSVMVTGLGDEWPDLPDAGLMGERLFTQAQWRSLLGRAMFSLPEPHAPKYNPSFRSLISYFVRRGHDAFGDPFRHFRNQRNWDIQLHVGLLLGLEWRHAVRWQVIKDREHDVRNLRKLIDRGAVPHLGGSIGELETERVTLAQRIAASADAIKTFQVHPEYKSIRNEANQLTEELHQRANENVVASRRLDLYRKAIQAEEPPSEDLVAEVYEEMGVVFSEGVLRSLAEAREFYASVVRDRRHFLQREIDRLESQIADTYAKIRELTTTRAKLLEILSTHGAIEEMVQMQERHAARCRDLERVRDQIESRQQMESDQRRVARDRADLAELAARDYEERRKLWNTPVGLFNLNSQALYRAPGRLVIDTTDSGLKFNIEITKSGSDGIGKMKIFCFDLALIEFSVSRELRIDFLVHDSEMYDGVDSRQRAAAIQRARDVADATGTQYICALNSDMVPYGEFREGFMFDEYVRLRLTDGDPAGTLLGMVFDPVASP